MKRSLPLILQGCLLLLTAALSTSGCIIVNGGGDMPCGEGMHGQESDMYHCTGDDTQCSTDCRDRSDQAYASCLESGASSEECMDYAGEILLGCQEGCGGDSAPSCGTECEDTRYETYMSCLEVGNSESQCKEDAELAYNSCVNSSCGSTDPADGTDSTEPDGSDPNGDGGEDQPDGDDIDSNGDGIPDSDDPDAPDDTDPSQPPPDEGGNGSPECGQDCEEQAHSYFEECLASGMPEDECQERFMMQLESCAQNCETPTQPPPSTDCDQSCEAYASGVYSECMVLLGDPYTCQQHTQLAYQSCMYGCDQGDSSGEPVPPSDPPDSDPACEDHCNVEAMQILEECLATGNDPERCHAQYEEMLSSCMANCSGDPQEPTPTPVDPNCQDRCNAYATDVYNQCMAENNAPERCKQLYSDTLNSCTLECSDEPPSEPPPATPIPEPSACVERCESVATDAYNQCVQSGVDPAQCKERYMMQYDSCMESCTAP